MTESMGGGAESLRGLGGAGGAYSHRHTGQYGQKVIGSLQFKYQPLNGSVCGTSEQLTTQV